MKAPTRRILHVIDTGGPGGGETVLVSLVTALSDRDWKSRVVLPRRHWLSNQLERQGVEYVVHKGRGAFDLSFLMRILIELRSFQPVLIHAHFLTSGVYGSLAATLGGAYPLVCTFHGVPDVSPSDPMLNVKARILTRSGNRIVYVSYHLRRHLSHVLGLPESLGVVIHNGVDFLEPSGLTEIRRELAIPQQTCLIGAVGNLRPAKDYANLLHAAQVVCDARSDAHFVVCGSGEDREVDLLLRTRAALGLDSRFHFLGFRSDVPQIIRELDLFVSSSLNEGLPLASVEALGMGKPVVLTRCGGVPELVEHGKTGFLVPPGDPMALAQGILTLIEDHRLARSLATRAREEVRREFSLERMVNAYERLYEGLLRGGVP